MRQLESNYFYADIPRRSRTGTRHSSSIPSQSTQLGISNSADFAPRKLLPTFLSSDPCVLCSCFRLISFDIAIDLNGEASSIPIPATINQCLDCPPDLNAQVQIPQSPPRIPRTRLYQPFKVPRLLSDSPKYPFAGKSCTAFQISRPLKPPPTPSLLSNHDLNHDRSNRTWLMEIRANSRRMRLSPGSPQHRPPIPQPCLRRPQPISMATSPEAADMGAASQIVGRAPSP